ncbi:hypothetical protein AB0H07_17680 [Streptomyces sp. NPDC021354]|uniref:hypothetical protein n=1 Tax=Streptomyces sp. NPDC021354 TaxID=3154793 RepID=UPI0033C5DA26
MNPEEDDMTDQVWPGTTCASWLWIFSTEYAQFEARKAIANLSQARMPPRTSRDPDVNEVLRAVKAADEIQKSSAEALSVAVAEAVARGATWRQVGEQLGIGKTGAHNKFGRGLTSDQKFLLKEESDAARLCSTCWLGDSSEDILGFDSEEWEAAPPYVAVQHVWRRTSKAYILLKQAILDTLDPEDDKWATTFHRSYEQLRGAVRVILTPKYLQVIQECSRKLPPGSPRDPHGSAVTTLIQFGIRAVSAFMRIAQPSQGESSESRMRNLLLAIYDLEQAAYCLAKPATFELIKVIEGEIDKQGDSVYLADIVEDNRSLSRLYDFYHQGDTEALSVYFGEDITTGAGLTMEAIREILAEDDD